MSVAHDVEVTLRTEDVHISESITFAELLLSAAVLDGLTKAGFKRPSPIQLKAIPLGRCGLDLIVQAKSGTGKTCVFSVIALEGVDVASDSAQVLVLAPTREIAIQISSVIQTLGVSLQGLVTHSFIGGTPLLQDKIQAKNCHIAVGTPGRIKQLIELGALRTGSLRLLVLDEADKLLDGNFSEAINWIYSMLPDNKQILALSATYPEYLANELTKYMRNPTFIRLNISDPALIGIKQYHHIVPNHHLPNKIFDYKTEAIIKILSNVSFQQCLIFSNLQTRAQTLRDDLQARNWPAVCIAGCLDQKERNFAIDQLKTYQCRILISTDLTARGIDADRVNLVINLDVPYDHETYLHRIGRAGRFGNFGAAISIVSKGGQDKELWMVEKKCKTHIPKLPDPIPKDLVERKVEIKLSDIVSSERIVTCEQGNAYPMAFESNSESPQVHLNECLSEPQKLQPLLSSPKDAQEKVGQGYKYSSNVLHRLEHQKGSPREDCEMVNGKTCESCDSPGLVCHCTEVNDRELGHEQEKPVYRKDDCEITKQKCPQFPSLNDHVDVDPQSIPLQTCYEEECVRNSADYHIPENGNSVISPTDSKTSNDVQKTQFEMFRHDFASSHRIICGEKTDSQTHDSDSSLSQRIHSVRQDVNKSTETDIPEKFDDEDSEKSNASFKKKYSFTQKTKNFQTSNKDRLHFRPLAVSHFISNSLEDNIEDISSLSSAVDSSYSSSTTSSEVSKTTAFPKADFAMNEGLHCQAANSIPEKNAHESRESTLTEAFSVILDKNQCPPSHGKLLPHAPTLDLKQSSSHNGLSNVRFSSVQSTDNETTYVESKGDEGGPRCLADVPTENYRPDDKDGSKFLKRVERTLPLMEMILYQEISVDKSVDPKECNQQSKRASVTVKPYYSAKAKVDKQSDKACTNGRGDTANSGEREDFSACHNQRTETQISASVNALTFFHTPSESKNASAVYKHLCDCSKISSQTDVPQKNFKDEISIPVQSLTLDSLRSFGRVYGDEVSLLYNLKENLINQIENIRRKGQDKPEQSMKLLHETQLEQSCDETQGGLNISLKEDEKLKSLGENEKKILLSIEQKIKDSNDGSDLDREQKGKDLMQGFPESLSEHHDQWRATNQVTAKDIDESERSISFPQFLHTTSDIHNVDDQAAKTEPESASQVKMSTVEPAMKAESRLESGEKTAKTLAVTNTFQIEKWEDSHHDRLSQYLSISNKQKSTKDKKLRRAGRFVRNPREHVVEAQDQTLISQNVSLEAARSVAQIPTSLLEDAVGKQTGIWKNRTKKSVSQTSSYLEDSSESEDSTESYSYEGKRDKNFTSSTAEHLVPSHKHQKEQMQKRCWKKKTVPDSSFNCGPFADCHFYGAQSQQHFLHRQHPLKENRRVRSFHENSNPIETFPSFHTARQWYSYFNQASLPDLHFSGHWAPYGNSFCRNQPFYSYVDVPQQQLSWPFPVSSQQIFHPSVFQNVSQMPSYASLYINHMTKVTQSLHKKYFT